jgi:hypothetical protein
MLHSLCFFTADLALFSQTPVGYSDFTSGLLGATLLLSGLVAAIATAPLFDRVFTHHLAIICKVLVAMVSGAWLSLIWAVKSGDIGGLYAVVAIIGACSVTNLPVGLELGCELTRNSGGSSALLWFSCVPFNSNAFPYLHHCNSFVL